MSWNRDVPAEKLSFTMRREFDRQKEESELIEQLRQIIESRLKMALPKDVASALTDGVVLCHLANHVRPRSVASIHVPSAAVVSLRGIIHLKTMFNFGIFFSAEINDGSLPTKCRQFLGCVQENRCR